MDQAVTMMLNATWSQLKSDISKEFKKEGRDPSKMIFKPSLKMQYLGMLDDLEVESPFDTLQEEKLDELKRRYDDLFEQIFKRGTKSPELGYHITKAIGTGIVPVPKPKLPEEDYTGKEPPESASKGYRDIFWDEKWHEASIWEMELVRSGNIVNGPSVIEAPATTLLVPPEHQVTLDTHRIFHMEVGK
jgi:N-methylhydantoinase A/acetone carboxylase beta subunit